ncbi:MAG: hypothetical protein C4519_00305 [Desulfobacteraceae bacterium]|nr:MAG: hypothetical protein C4519_00305 [Desulfobacteraceae bacterium]
MENQPGKTPDPGRGAGEQVIEIDGQKLTPAQIKEALKSHASASTTKAEHDRRASEIKAQEARLARMQALEEAGVNVDAILQSTAKKEPPRPKRYLPDPNDYEKLGPEGEAKFFSDYNETLEGHIRRQDETIETLKAELAQVKGTSTTIANVVAKKEFMTKHKLSDDQFRQVAEYGAKKGIGVINVGTERNPVLVIDPDGLEDAFVLMTGRQARESVGRGDTDAYSRALADLLGTSDIPNIARSKIPRSLGSGGGGEDDDLVEMAMDPVRSSRMTKEQKLAFNKSAAMRGLPPLLV